MIRHNQYVSHPDDFRAAGRVLRSGWVAQGPEVQVLEDALADRFGRPCCVVSSGTAALYLAVEMLGGGEVSIPSYACSALYRAAKMACDWYPIDLADIDPVTFNRLPSDCYASVYVHTYGVPVRVQGDRTISDVTHALGATLDGVPVEKMGTFAVCSMGPTKLLSSPGGGFILGDSDAIAECRKLRDSLNLTTSDLHAAIARERLKRLDEELDIRDEIAMDYWDAMDFGTKDGVGYQQRPASSIKSTKYRYVIRVKDWHQAQAHFARRGIETINPLMTEELLHRQLGLPASDFPNAEEVAKTTLSLPIYPSLSVEERQRVAEALYELES